MQQKNGTGKRLISGKKIIRMIALLLAVLLLLNLIPYNNTAIKMIPANFDNNASTVAAKQLISDSPYLSGSRIQRMETLINHYVSPEGTLEYSEVCADIAINNGDYEEAIKYTDQSISLCNAEISKLGTLYLRKGYLYTLLGDNGKALEWLNKGIHYSPDPEAYLTRAQVKANSGDLSGALEDVNIYIDTAENSVAMLPNLINVYESNGDYATSYELYTRLINDPQACRTSYYLERAYCSTMMGNMDDAEKDCETYREKNGKYDNTVELMLGIGFMRNEQYDKARTHFVAAAEADPEGADRVDYYIVLCAYISGDYETACAYGDKIVARVNAGEDVSTAQLSQNMKGQVEVTLAATDIASLCKMTGAAHVQRGDYDKAAESLTACLASTGDTEYAYYLRGTSLLATGDYANALEDFTNAIAAGEEIEKSRYGRGICYLQLGNYDAAIEDLDWVMMNGEDADLFDQAGQLVNLIFEKQKAQAQDSQKQTDAEDTATTAE